MNPNQINERNYFKFYVFMRFSCSLQLNRVAAFCLGYCLFLGCL